MTKTIPQEKVLGPCLKEQSATRSCPSIVVLDQAKALLICILIPSRMFMVRSHRVDGEKENRRKVGMNRSQHASEMNHHAGALRPASSQKGEVPGCGTTHFSKGLDLAGGLADGSAEQGNLVQCGNHMALHYSDTCHSDSMLCILCFFFFSHQRSTYLSVSHVYVMYVCPNYFNSYMTRIGDIWDMRHLQ